MSKKPEMTLEQSFFAVFCIEALADEPGTSGDINYSMLDEKSDILDGYILPCYASLHTQGKEYIVRELIELMTKHEAMK
jgi:hypothetical protein